MADFTNTPVAKGEQIPESLVWRKTSEESGIVKAAVYRKVKYQWFGVLHENKRCVQCRTDNVNQSKGKKSSVLHFSKSSTNMFLKYSITGNTITLSVYLTVKVLSMTMALSQTVIVGYYTFHN